MKNKKVLIIFKYPRGNWNYNIISKFSNYYKTVRARCMLKDSALLKC